MAHQNDDSNHPGRGNGAYTQGPAGQTPPHMHPGQGQPPYAGPHPGHPSSAADVTMPQGGPHTGSHPPIDYQLPPEAVARYADQQQAHGSPGIAGGAAAGAHVAAVHAADSMQGNGGDNGSSGKPPRFEKPQRKKLRKNRFVRFVQLMMSLAFIAAICAIGFFMYSRYQVDRPGPLAERMIFEVERGQGLSTIAAQLQRKGVIRDKKLFAMNAIATKTSNKLKAGKYAIPPQASMQKVLDILVEGKAIFYQVTIPEGLTSQQAVEILMAHPQLAGDVAGIPPEGHVRPDTYRFSDGANRSKLLTRMVASQEAILQDLWTKRQPGLPLKTPKEALILASIVEKETGVSSERRQVAGVFINRLRKGMKLQSDPTIIYGLVGGKGKLGHPLRVSEMKKQTAYNTYQIAGLPPTPIANPGRKAIEAVLNPEATDYLYFVADGTGGHAFAATLKGHQANVRKWRKIERQRRAEEKRRKEEAAKLAALEARLEEKNGVKTETRLPGVTVSKEGAERLSAFSKDGWDSSVDVPIRNPRR